MKWSISIYILIISLLGIYTPIYAHNEYKYELELERINRCGYIFEFLPDGSIICVTRYNKVGMLGAEVRLLDTKSNKLIKLADVADVYVGDNDEPAYERGLVGLTLDPRFKENRYVYLHYTYKDNDDGKQYKKVVRYVYDDNSNRLTDMKILIDRIPAYKNHNGGPLEFGPDDKLYITNGDADDSPQSRKRVLGESWKRSLDTLEGKILRIDRDGNVPKDNPYPDSPVYTIGHRNVWGIAFHPVTGMAYVTENGPESDDEINILYKGMDYGWPVTLGYDKPAVDEFERYNFNPDYHVRPIWSSGHIATAPTQLTFYTDSKYEEFINDLLFLTLNDSSLNRIKLSEDYTRVKEFHVYPLGIGIPTDIEVYNGDIYVSNLYNDIYRVNFINLIDHTNNKNNNSALSLNKDRIIVDKYDTLTLRARLVDGNGEPLVYMPINFMVDDTIVGTVRTDDKGYASLKYTFIDSRKHTIRALFNGDSSYMQSHDEYSLVVMDTINASDRKAVYRLTLLDKGKPDPTTIVRVTLMPVDETGRVYVNTPTLLVVEFVDTKGSPVEAQYKLTLVDSDGNKILSDDGNNDSNIHIFTVDDTSDTISLFVEDRERVANISFRAVPEFGINTMIIYTSIIAILVFLIILYKNGVVGRSGSVNLTTINK